MKSASSPHLSLRIEKTQARLRKLRDPKDPRLARGEFFFLLDVTAKETDLYIPLSIASGKKPTGFVYQIEGTAAGIISTTDISSKGAGVTQITLGTVLYVKIPAGKTGTFRILVETRGKVGKEYRVTITQITYKLSPNDARYQKLPVSISTKPSRLL